MKKKKKRQHKQMLMSSLKSKVQSLKSQVKPKKPTKKLSHGKMAAKKPTVLPITQKSLEVEEVSSSSSYSDSSSSEDHSKRPMSQSKIQLTKRGRMGKADIEKRI